MERRNKILVIVGSILVLVLVLPFMSLLLFKYHKSSEDISNTPSISINSGEDFREDIALHDDKGNSAPIDPSDSNYPEKRIVKTGNIVKSVDKFDESESNLRKIVDSNNGEIAFLRDDGEGSKRILNIRIKVPVSNFEKLFSDLKNMRGDNITSSANVSDITTEVIDLEARLKNLKNTESQLLEILKKANSVSDTVSVYKELNEVRGNIESLESRLKYYSNQSDYSFINVTLRQSSVGGRLEDSKWRPLGVLKDATRAYVSALKIFGTILIYAVIFLSPILFVYVIFRIVKKSVKK